MLNYTTRTAAIFIVALFASHHSFAQTSGADIFKTKCAMCHGETGLVILPLANRWGWFPINPQRLLKMTTAAMTALVKNGKNNKMPAFNGQLTDAQIKDVLLYVRTLQKK